MDTVVHRGVNKGRVSMDICDCIRVEDLSGRGTLYAKPLRLVPFLPRSLTPPTRTLDFRRIRVRERAAATHGKYAMSTLKLLRLFGPLNSSVGRSALPGKSRIAAWKQLRSEVGPRCKTLPIYERRRRGWFYM